MLIFLCQFLWNDRLKVGLSLSKKICVTCLIESPLKMMKNIFYFVLKAFFVLKIFKFLSRYFGHVGKTVYDFSRKMFLMLHSINWPNFIIWLPFLLEILGYMCIKIVWNFIKFEINLIFLIKLFRHMTKKSRQKL